MMQQIGRQASRAMIVKAGDFTSKLPNENAKQGIAPPPLRAMGLPEAEMAKSQEKAKAFTISMSSSTIKNIKDLLQGTDDKKPVQVHQNKTKGDKKIDDFIDKHPEKTLDFADFPKNRLHTAERLLGRDIPDLSKVKEIYDKHSKTIESVSQLDEGEIKSAVAKATVEHTLIQAAKKPQQAITFMMDGVDKAHTISSITDEKQSDLINHLTELAKHDMTQLSVNMGENVLLNTGGRLAASAIGGPAGVALNVAVTANQALGAAQLGYAISDAAKKLDQFESDNPGLLDRIAEEIHQKADTKMDSKLE
ncbi:hypothetical protein H0A36_09175 [Endozoicomonas sp. SM1973]|uniref:Uncharacterized protein n=1 Tax=Spartinivicinus marinus TaxID=2994442 RepID=A0A853I7X9_9GAMM|nr:hypothetical protein [Spartinivicinus marinus]MCX4028141.1 hypothetical protein [Spartinivicinus marinus]NYZ66184.1 hypothetical protein [Spartinivicinus marinus]